MGAVSEPAWLLSHQVHHRNPRTYYVCVDIKYCSRADSESRNIRISADRLGLTPRSVHLQGRASPFLPEDRVPRHQPRLFPRTRFRGRTTPPSVATLNSVDLACRRWGKKKKIGVVSWRRRGSPPFWSGDIFICFLALRSVFFLVCCRTSFDISSLRFLGLPVTPFIYRQPPWAGGRL